MILVTGSTGFVGQKLIVSLLENNNKVSALVHRFSSQLPQDVNQFVNDFCNDDFKGDLKEIDIVIHLTARVHIMDESSADPLMEFRKVNSIGTLSLARRAAEVGVKRFIFISSIKVNGGSAEQGRPFTENDWFMPSDPYGLSKYEAE